MDGIAIGAELAHVTEPNQQVRVNDRHHYGTGGPIAVIDAHCDVYHADNPEMKERSKKRTRGRVLDPEWRDTEADGSPVLDVVLRYGRMPVSS